MILLAYGNKKAKQMHSDADVERKNGAAMFVSDEQNYTASALDSQYN